MVPLSTTHIFSSAMVVVHTVIRGAWEIFRLIYAEFKVPTACSPSDRTSMKVERRASSAALVPVRATEVVVVLRLSATLPVGLPPYPLPRLRWSSYSINEWREKNM